MVIASDGVWEFLSNESVAETVDKCYELQDPNLAVECIVEQSTKQWLTVNILFLF